MANFELRFRDMLIVDYIKAENQITNLGRRLYF
jgi:hypothetical protein